MNAISNLYKFIFKYNRFFSNKKSRRSIKSILNTEIECNQPQLKIKSLLNPTIECNNIIMIKLLLPYLINIIYI